MWTRFMDMHSGGGLKESPYEYIFIEASKAEAVVIFYNRFGHSPDRVSCTCCGNDYSYDDSETLEQATAFDRGCAYVYRRPDGTECDEREGFVSGKGMSKGYTSGYEETPATTFKFNEFTSLDVYLKREDILVIRAADIKDSERHGEVPEQGYVWRD